MTDFRRSNDNLDITGFHIVEGLPGTGLVAKTASDYIIEKLDMELYAEIYSRDLPQAAVFERGEAAPRPSVRVFVSPEHELAVFKSDSPVSAAADDFIEDMVSWMQEEQLVPVLQSALPIDVKEGEHAMFHAVSGDRGVGDRYGGIDSQEYSELEERIEGLREQIGQETGEISELF